MRTPVGRGDLFESCPLCRKGAVRQAPAGWWSLHHSILGSCGICGAVFVGTGAGSYRLRSCDPARLGTARGRSRPHSGCAECPPTSECYLELSLAKADWEHVGRGEPPEPARAALEKRSRLEAGELPELPAERSPVPLEPGERLYHVSIVYTCEQPLPGRSKDEGKLAVTSRRIVLVHEGASFEIGLDAIDRLEKAFPGFLIYTKGSVQPYCFFPLRGDPVFEAIGAALRRARDKRPEEDK